MEEQLKVLTQPRLLIIDEISYIPLRVGLVLGDEQPELGRLGRDIWRPSDRECDPRPTPPLRDGGQDSSQLGQNLSNSVLCDFNAVTVHVLLCSG